MYPSIKKGFNLRNLEKYTLYDYKNEEIYNLDEEAFRAARFFTGRWNVDEISIQTGIDANKIKEFTEELIQNDIIIDKKIPNGKLNLDDETQKSPIPSLRSILMHITQRCNLKCVHCYLGEKKALDLPLNLIKTIIPEFYKLQGLRVLISGGEPLMHPQFRELLIFLGQFPLRIMVLTNGYLITPDITKFIKNYVHEVQISIDGIESHNEFRADKNAFSQAINAIKLLKNAEIPVEVATMIHKKNLDELEQLSRLLKKLDVENWTLDVPILTGDLEKNINFVPDLEKAVEALKKYGWGGFPEEESSIFACGSHVCAIMPDGNVSKCQFFGDQPVGNLNNNSLLDCWKIIQKNYIWKQEDLQCAKINCPYLEECKGGCRYRAYTLTKDMLGVDKLRCHSYNFQYNHKK
ncbi:MAG: radical SAM protein [Promethearchaeota archaeon]